VTYFLVKLQEKVNLETDFDIFVCFEA